MLKGVHLTLVIGPGSPTPAPHFVIDALESVQITSGTHSAGFQLTFKAGKKSPLVTTLIPAGYFDPIVTRVHVIVTLRGVPHVLMDGIITQQEVAPANEPGQSTITITGEDLSVLMDLVEMRFMRYPAQSVAMRVLSMLAKYAALGIGPVVIPPVLQDFPDGLEKIPTHHGTDLQYIKELASECGYVFYVEPGPAPGVSTAYFGPDVRIPVPQPALNVNMDAHTNVESLSFSLDGMAKKVVVYTVYDNATRKIPITLPVPNVSLVRPPLGARLTPPAKVEFAESTTKLDATEATLRVLGDIFNSSDAITGSGSLDVVRYGRPLRSRMLVGVRGAGVAYDGLYYVNSVTHNLKRGEYKQNFSLSRDGLISQTPVVPTNEWLEAAI
jgi:hypothetical protein